LHRYTLASQPCILDLSRIKTDGGLTSGAGFSGFLHFCQIQSFVYFRSRSALSSVEAAVPADYRVPAGETPACAESATTGYPERRSRSQRFNRGFETHSLPALARRYPRGFSFCLAVPTARLADYTDMDRSECVYRILHCLPACVREVRPRESFRSWECEASSHRFSINGLLPQKRREDARTQAGRQCALQKSRHCGTKHNGRKFAQARHGEFVLWRTAKISIDSSTGIKNSLSVIPSEVEESLDIFSILLPGQSRTIIAAPRLLFRGLRSPTPCHPEDKSISRRLAALLAPFRPMRVCASLAPCQPPITRSAVNPPNKTILTRRENRNRLSET